jgi:hypothetical protein
MRITDDLLGERTYKSVELFIVDESFDQKLNISNIKDLIACAPQVFY